MVKPMKPEEWFIIVAICACNERSAGIKEFLSIFNKQFSRKTPWQELSTCPESVQFACNWPDTTRHNPPPAALAARAHTSPSMLFDGTGEYATEWRDDEGKVTNIHFIKRGEE
jgi:hypothetical protein